MQEESTSKKSMVGEITRCVKRASNAEVFNVSSFCYDKVYQMPVLRTRMHPCGLVVVGLLKQGVRNIKVKLLTYSEKPQSIFINFTYTVTT